ncbi:MAG: hypothetical protein LBE15_05055 [Burkholderiales bacterium]|jgi:hypothetical protein|nr:hypothetical protein [Burkholderiales bacterium]
MTWFLALIALLLPWLTGAALLYAAAALTLSRTTVHAPGEIFWRLGAGAFLGYWLVTCLMRLLALLGIPFGLTVIALPLLLITALAVFVGWQRAPFFTLSPRGRGCPEEPAPEALLIGGAGEGANKTPPLQGESWGGDGFSASPSPPAPLPQGERGAERDASSQKCALLSQNSFLDLPKLTRYLFFALLAWLALRFGLLFFEVSTRPLFPWEASIQWASKAHVYFGLKTLAPFGDSTAWFNGNFSGNVYLDNAPNLPITLPLLQAWMCVAIGKWNDVLMNLPWWGMLLALTFAVYGFMRSQGLGPFASLITAWLVASLPLLNTHVALAGLPDLPLAGTFTLAALSLMRWSHSRQWLDLFCALLFALIAAMLWPTAYLWLALLLPALVCILLPKSARILALALPVVTIAGLLTLTQAGASLSPALANLHFDTDPDTWLSNFITGENWHLLWLAALATTVIGLRECLHTRIAPLTFIVWGGILISVVAIALPELVSWLFGAMQAERLLITVAPLILVWVVIVFRERFLSP